MKSTVLVVTITIITQMYDGVTNVSLHCACTAAEPPQRVPSAGNTTLGPVCCPGCVTDDISITGWRLKWSNALSLIPSPLMISSNTQSYVQAQAEWLRNIYLGTGTYSQLTFLSSLRHTDWQNHKWAAENNDNKNMYVAMLFVLVMRKICSCHYHSKILAMLGTCLDARLLLIHSQLRSSSWT